MDIGYINNSITTMQHHLDAANKYLNELAKGYRSAEKQNTLLDAAMQQVELCCIDMRNLCEKSRPNIPTYGNRVYNSKEIFGEVTQLDNGWIDIRLNALLPHCRMIGGTQYVFDSITRLLDTTVKTAVLFLALKRHIWLLSSIVRWTVREHLITITRALEV